MAKAANEVELFLKPAPSDPKQNDPAYQKELRSVTAAMREKNIRYSQSGMVFDAVGAEGFALGTFTIQVAPAIITGLLGIVTGWISANKGRRVRIKKGDVEIEANNPDEIQKLLPLLKSIEAETKSEVKPTGKA